MRKFAVDYTFQGRATDVRHANSQEELEAAIYDELNADDFEMDADEIDDVDFQIQEMHPVTRAGREIWTTYVLDSDMRGHQSAIDNSPLFAGGGA